MSIEDILKAIDDLPAGFGHPMWDTAAGRANLRLSATAAAVEGMPLEEILPMLLEVVEGTSTQFPR